MLRLDTHHTIHRIIVVFLMFVVLSRLKRL